MEKGRAGDRENRSATENYNMMYPMLFSKKWNCQNARPDPRHLDFDPLMDLV